MTLPSARFTRACSSTMTPPQVPTSPGHSWTAQNGGSAIGPSEAFGLLVGSA
jgi:hypothetical protein